MKRGGASELSFPRLGLQSKKKKKYVYKQKNTFYKQVFTKSCEWNNLKKMYVYAVYIICPYKSRVRDKMIIDLKKNVAVLWWSQNNWGESFLNLVYNVHSELPFFFPFQNLSLKFPNKPRLRRASSGGLRPRPNCPWWLVLDKHAARLASRSAKGKTTVSRVCVRLGTFFFFLVNVQFCSICLNVMYLFSEEEVIEEEEFLEEDGYLEEEEFLSNDDSDSKISKKSCSKSRSNGGPTRVKRTRVFRIARGMERQRGERLWFRARKDPMQEGGY